MAHADRALDDAGLNRLRQLSQPQKVGHRRSAFADSGRGLVLSETELMDQAMIGFGLFNRIQVGPLDVLHQRHFQQLVVVDRSHHHRDLTQSGAPRGAQTALAGDQLEAGVDLAHHQRLQDSLPPDRFGQFLQLGFGKLAAGLKAVGPNELDIAQEIIAGAVLGTGNGAGNQRLQTPAQGELLAFGGWVLR